MANNSGSNTLKSRAGSRSWIAQFADKSQYRFIDCTLIVPTKTIFTQAAYRALVRGANKLFPTFDIWGDWGIEARLEFKRWTKEKRGYFLEKGGRVPESESHVRGRHKKRRVVDIHEEGREE